MRIFLVHACTPCTCSSEDDNSCSESSSSSSSEDSDVQELSSDEEMESVSTKTPSSKQLARPTLQLSSSGFRWDVGVAKGRLTAGTNREETSSESEEEDDDEKEVHVGVDGFSIQACYFCSVYFCDLRATQV